ncbi:MAG: hypothetical protein JXA42_13350 [Anaerolineales bacterium]|nr:hypothetical protein [Anaerolineales bacterium]
MFLIDKLDAVQQQAHDLACQMEHGTTDWPADRLDAFLSIRKLIRMDIQSRWPMATRPIRRITRLKLSHVGKPARLFSSR